MASIIRHAMRLTSVRRLLAVIGGFHLSGPAFEPVVAALTGLAPELIAPGHCTGWRVQHILAAMLPDAWVLDEPAIPRSGPDWLTVSPEPWRLPHVIAEAERMTRYPI